MPQENKIPVTCYNAFMEIMLNGKSEHFPGCKMAVSELLDIKGWSFPLINVSINGKHIPRDKWDVSTVGNNDRVEAIHLMSGG
ncbi:hypothetical protein MASR2M29_01150 [Spirochaetota bacterium]